MLVFVDTMTLIWGIRQEASDDNEARIQEARAFFRDMASRGRAIGVAAPTLAEYLVKTPEADRHNVFKEFSRVFTVYPFDTGAAHESVRLWCSVYGNASLGAVARALDIPRQVLKVDHQIASIAVYRKAEYIVTYDDGLERFARHFIPVRKLPPVQQEIPLFGLENMLQAAPISEGEPLPSK